MSCRFWRVDPADELVGREAPWHIRHIVREHLMFAVLEAERKEPREKPPVDVPNTPFFTDPHRVAWRQRKIAWLKGSHDG